MADELTISTTDLGLGPAAANATIYTCDVDGGQVHDVTTDDGVMVGPLRLHIPRAGEVTIPLAPTASITEPNTFYACEIGGFKRVFEKASGLEDLHDTVVPVSPAPRTPALALDGLSDVDSPIGDREPGQVLTVNPDGETASFADPGGGGGGGAVGSVNGQTGVVVLDANDVDAIPETAAGADGDLVQRVFATGDGPVYGGLSKDDLAADPAFADAYSPIGAVESVVAGSGVTVDSTDPQNPVVSASGGGGGGSSDFGSINGELIMPWAPSPQLGPNLWQVANFVDDLVGNVNTTDDTPSVPANGNDNVLRTRIALGDMGIKDQCFRLAFDIDAWPTDGWAWMKFSLCEPGGTSGGYGTKTQLIASNSGVNQLNGHFEIEFKLTAPTGDTTFDLWMRVFQNATVGAMSISNVVLCRVGHVSRPLSYGQVAGTGQGGVFTELHDPVSDEWLITETDLTAETDLHHALGQILAFDHPRIFQYPSPDPLLLADYTDFVTPIGSTAGLLPAGTIQRSIRSNNNDQIIEVLGTDAAFHLTGNSHNHEFEDTFALYADHGTGWVGWSDTSNNVRRWARRVQARQTTRFKRPPGDATTFATVDKTLTFFADGMMRMDRETTFTADTTVRLMIEWMSSHSTEQPRLGRIGNGHVTLGEFDAYPKVSPPAAPTAGTSSTGGALIAGTYTYQITALAEGGETTPSPTVAQVVPAGTSTNKVTLTLPSVTNAVGFRIYGRAAGVGRLRLIATIGVVSTWDDTGALPPVGPVAPDVNTARRVDQATIDPLGSESHATANWAAWYDLPLGMVYGNIVDVDEAFGRDDVTAISNRLGTYLAKNYFQTYGEAAANVIPAGTVWRATHWSYTYMPQDRERWEAEIAARAANFALLPDLYPTD